MSAHTVTIEPGYAIESGDHPIEVLEHDTGDTVVHDFTDRSAVERGHWSAARHRFSHHEAEGLAGLNRIQQRSCAAVQLDLRLEVGLTDVDDLSAVDVRSDVLAVIRVFRGGEQQSH